MKSMTRNLAGLLIMAAATWATGYDTGGGRWTGRHVVTPPSAGTGPHRSHPYAPGHSPAGHRQNASKWSAMWSGRLPSAPRLTDSLSTTVKLTRCDERCGWRCSVTWPTEISACACACAGRGTDGKNNTRHGDENTHPTLHHTALLWRPPLCVSRQVLWQEALEAHQSKPV